MQYYNHPVLFTEQDYVPTNDVYELDGIKQQNIRNFETLLGDSS